MDNKKSGKDYQIAGFVCLGIGVIFVIFDVFFMSFISFAAFLCLVFYGNWIKVDEQTKKEYNEFVYSTAIKTGSMTIEQVKDVLRSQHFVTDQEIATPESGICPTCGGKVINGKCQYCGNVYESNSDIVVLSYSCKYGTKAYTFKNGILDKIQTHANPIEDFLIFR
jgi:hypothetical protein